MLDFYCAKANLAVEKPERDQRRDAWLKKHGVTVMRIAAAELSQDIDQAADAIVRAAMEML